MGINLIGLYCAFTISLYNLNIKSPEDANARKNRAIRKLLNKYNYEYYVLISLLYPTMNMTP